MKLFFYCLIGLLVWSCNESEVDTEVKEKSQPEIKANGAYKDYYPNGQIKIEGQLNNDKKKEGTWTSYFENGKKNSESVFKNGVNNGYSMVWYPNGNVHYFGDYTDGKRSGKWTFYDESGVVVKTKSY